MGFRGRHKEILGEVGYEEAKRNGKLADIYIGSGVTNVPISDPAVARLMRITTPLSEEAKREVFEEVSGRDLEDSRNLPQNRPTAAPLGDAVVIE